MIFILIVLFFQINSKLFIDFYANFYVKCIQIYKKYLNVPYIYIKMYMIYKYFTYIYL